MISVNVMIKIRFLYIEDFNAVQEINANRKNNIRICLFRATHNKGMANGGSNG